MKIQKAEILIDDDSFEPYVRMVVDMPICVQKRGDTEEDEWLQLGEELAKAIGEYGLPWATEATLDNKS